MREEERKWDPRDGYNGVLAATLRKDLCTR
jgi:hypothetical protein